MHSLSHFPLINSLLLSAFSPLHSTTNQYIETSIYIKYIIALHSRTQEILSFGFIYAISPGNREIGYDITENYKKVLTSYDYMFKCT